MRCRFLTRKGKDGNKFNRQSRREVIVKHFNERRMPARKKNCNYLNELHELGTSRLKSCSIQVRAYLDTPT
jgi:hypothetical protein